MSKTGFRRIDVDQYDEEKFKDDQLDQADTGPDEDSVNQLLLGYPFMKAIAFLALLSLMFLVCLLFLCKEFNRHSRTLSFFHSVIEESVTSKDARNSLLMPVWSNNFDLRAVLQKHDNLQATSHKMMY